MSSAYQWGSAPNAWYRLCLIGVACLCGLVATMPLVDASRFPRTCRLCEPFKLWGGMILQCYLSSNSVTLAWWWEGDRGTAGARASQSRWVVSLRHPAACFPTAFLLHLTVVPFTVSVLHVCLGMGLDAP